MKHLKKFFKGENWEKCRALTLFDLFKSFKGDLFFFMVVAMIALGIIKCQTVSKKLGDFLIQNWEFFIQLSTNE